MKERPIIFSGPSVIAIQQDRKTQTRRIIKPQPPPHCVNLHEACNGWAWTDNALDYDYFPKRSAAMTCPHGEPGNRLWVRETFLRRPGFETISKPHYRADGEKSGWTWKSPIHMFRCDSRLLLEITEVRVQRVQEIDEADAQREGWAFEGLKPNQSYNPVVMDTAHQWYRSEWDRINVRKRPWSSNPWVWCISFRRVS